MVKREQNNETALKCNKCKKYTDSINPIIIEKESGNRYHISSRCKDCNNKKSKYLNMAQVKLLPPEISNAPNNTSFMNEIQRNGGAIPFGLLIPLITSVIQALPDIGKTIYNAVKGNGTEVSDIITLLKDELKKGTISETDIIKGMGLHYV